MAQYGNLDKRLYNSAKRQLAKARRNIREALKVYPENVPFVPQVPTLRDLSQMSRESAKETLAELRLFKGPRSARVQMTEGGAILSEYQEKVLKRQHNIVEKRKAKLREAAGTERERAMKGLMGSEFETSIRPKTLDINALTPDELRAISKRLEKQSDPLYMEKRNEQYFQNYIKALYENFGSDADRIVQLIQSLPYDTLYLISSTNEILNIDFWYTEDEREELVDDVYNMWQEFAGESDE